MTRTTGLTWLLQRGAAVSSARGVARCSWRHLPSAVAPPTRERYRKVSSSYPLVAGLCAEGGAACAGSLLSSWHIIRQRGLGARSCLLATAKCNAPRTATNAAQTAQKHCTVRN